MIFTVKGIDKATGAPVDEQLEAEHLAAATEQALARGIVITSITPAPVSDSPGAEVALQAPTLNYLSVGSGAASLKSRWKWALIFMGIEACLFFGVFALWVGFSGSGLFGAVAGLVTGMAFFVLQLSLILPVMKPQTQPGRTKPAYYWLGAIGFGLLLGAALVGAMWLAVDWYFESVASFPESGRDSAALVAIYLAGACWLISIPLIVAFMKRGRPESFLAKLSAALFLGSVVEFIAGIPILSLADRRENCTCANASFWSMVLAVMSASVILGPMIFLVILARRTRAASRGLCAVCGCDLRKLPNRDQCPQCGAGWKTNA